MSQSLTSQRQNIDLSVKADVEQVNVLSGQIAQLNGQITGLTNVHEDASSLIDQRDVLIGNLSQLIDVSTIQSDNGLTLTTSNGAPLVAGQVSFPLETQQDSSGVYHIYSEGSDVTSKLSSGGLAGLIQVRDQAIPTLLSKLDTLASGFANAFNTAHQGGYDLAGAKGGDFFVAPTASGTGAAANMAVQITDPSQVAASSDGSSGSNGNVAMLFRRPRPGHRERADRDRILRQPGFRGRQRCIEWDCGAKRIAAHLEPTARSARQHLGSFSG